MIDFASEFASDFASLLLEIGEPVTIGLISGTASIQRYDYINDANDYGYEERFAFTAVVSKVLFPTKPIEETAIILKRGNFRVVKVEEGQATWKIFCAAPTI